MNWRTAVLVALFAILAMAVAHAVTVLTTQTLTVSVDGLAKLSVPGALSLTPTGTSFSPFDGSMALNYRARTNVSGGSGTITVLASGDFTPVGGPSVTSGDLTFTCTGATLGSGCAGTQTVSTSSAQTVITLPAAGCTGGGGSCSATDPNTVTLQFQLSNRPAASTGTYQVTLQFTASAI
jgi:Tfp pilus assembly protein PilW